MVFFLLLWKVIKLSREHDHYTFWVRKTSGAKWTTPIFPSSEKVSFFQKHYLRSLGHLPVSAKSVLAYRIFSFFSIKRRVRLLVVHFTPFLNFKFQWALPTINRVNRVTSGSHQTKVHTIMFLWCWNGCWHSLVSTPNFYIHFIPELEG